jgi:hypothetical protein
MCRGIYLPEPIDRNQGVNLGSGNRRVAEQFLHYSHIGATFEKVSGKRVPQGVRRDFALQIGLRGGIRDDLPRALSTQATTALV